MALENELGNVNPQDGFADVCDHDGEDTPTRLPLEVLTSRAGAYLGTMCPRCGPYARKSGYYTTVTGAPNMKTAQEALRVTLAGAQDELRSTKFRPEHPLEISEIDDFNI